MSQFSRRHVLALLFGTPATAMAEPASVPESRIEDRYVKPEARALVEKQLVTSKDENSSNMGELSARLVWVQEGKQLPPEARRRTIIRANSMRPDNVGFGPWKEDVAPTKRNLSLWIISLDDQNKARLLSSGAQ